MTLAISLSAGLLAAGTAYAAPPQSRTGIFTRTAQPAEAHPGASVGAAASAGAGAGAQSRLDLRPPDFFHPGASPATHDSPEWAAISAMRQRGMDDERPMQGPQGQRQLFGIQQPPMTDESRVQEMARRFHREGLPLARLWEGHSALVSLGLNQRGKPGLWLIQKIP